MSTRIWPYIPPEELKKAEELSLARELSWLLDELQETLLSLKLGLEECCALLEPVEPGSTLVMSTPRTEYVKGHITRSGGDIMRGSLNLRLHTHPPITLTLISPAPSSSPSLQTPPPALSLSPLLKVRSLLSSALNCIVVTRWDGDRHSAPFISSQLRLLHGIFLEALALLKGPKSLQSNGTPSSRPSSAMGYLKGNSGYTSRSDTPPGAKDARRNAKNDGEEEEEEDKEEEDEDLAAEFEVEEEEPWNEAAIPATSFAPLLPPSLAITLTPSSSTLILTVRVLESAAQQPNLGSRLALAIGAQRRMEHDEMDAVVNFRGKEVRVREKVRVRSSVDPELVVLEAKLGSLERVLGGMRACLGVVMKVGEEMRRREP